MDRLDEHVEEVAQMASGGEDDLLERRLVRQDAPPVAAPVAAPVADDGVLPATPVFADELDPDLLPVFLEEGADLFPQIGNGLRHGLPPLVLTVECDGSAGLRVSVCDHDPTPPVRRDAGPDEESGRGMGLVDLVSDDWGVETSPAGKSVWFCLNRSSPAGDADRVEG